MNLGRTLVIMGLLLAAVGVLVMFSGKLPFKLGRLPGDIAIEGKGGGGFYFPVVTCLLISVVLTLVTWVAGKLR